MWLNQGFILSGQNLTAVAGRLMIYLQVSLTFWSCLISCSVQMVQMLYGLRVDGLKLKSMLSISVKHTFCAIAHNFDDWGYSKVA